MSGSTSLSTLTRSLPPRRVDLEVVGRLTAGDPRLGLQALDVDPSAVGVDVHVVGGLSVPLTVTLSTCAVTDARDRQVDVGPIEIGARHVVDRDRVGTAERRQVQLLDAVHVHADVSRAGAGTPTAVAVRRQAHLLGAGGAVEHERVVAGATLDEVTAVARVPHEAVVAGAEERGVVADATDDEVVAAARVDRCRRPRRS